MCTHCGCSSADEIVVTNLQTGRHVHVNGSFDPDTAAHRHTHGHGHAHDHDHAHTHHHSDDSGHAHAHAHSHGDHHTHEAATPRLVRLEQDVLAKNARLAERNRGWLAGRGVVALNLMSSPGAGKTTLLERTVKDLGATVSLHVIEGDQATLRDAERIRRAGGKVVQVNTGTGCHLDATMVAAALQQLDPPAGSLVIIENVGNLVCPALFDLGEAARVVLASVPEGDDKPVKYPHMFRAADVVVLNKTDLLPHVEFDVGAFEQRVRELNPRARVVHASARTGEGFGEWQNWILNAAAQGRPATGSAIP